MSKTREQLQIELLSKIRRLKMAFAPLALTPAAMMFFEEIKAIEATALDLGEYTDDEIRELQSKIQEISKSAPN
jgi:hypothetical protein